MPYSKEIQKYIEENYPYIEPCIKCKYWRKLAGGACFNKKSKMEDYCITTYPACHYGIYKGVNRELDFPCDGTCQYFKPRRGGGKKKADTMGGVHKSDEFKERGD